MTLPSLTVHDLGERSPETVEQIGSKFKRWFRLDDGLWLFKANRREVDGDDWAEVVAAHLAEGLGLPHACYELATWRGKRGVLSRLFGSKDRGLVHGNELFVDWAQVEGYPLTSPHEFSRIPQYTPDLVLDTLIKLDVHPNPEWSLPEGVRTGADVMVGYLMLDALIANTDRHDLNWAVEVDRSTDGGLLLAPTFDHASSFGHSLPDSKRQTRLRSTAAPHDLASFLARPRSRFHRSEGNPETLTPMTALRLAADRLPLAASAWLDRLAELDLNAADHVLERVPTDRISRLGIAFASALLAHTRRDLLSLRLLLH